jgi:hypothetical protein
MSIHTVNPNANKTEKLFEEMTEKTVDTKVGKAQLAFAEWKETSYQQRADVCNSARGMMLALGCVQALKCNTNECPTGVATNNPKFVRSLVVSEKWKRVRNYHKNILVDFLELLAVSGCHSPEEMNRSLIFKKVNRKWLSYAEEHETLQYGDIA